MKKVLVIIAAIAVSISTLSAQEADSRAEMHLQRLSQALELNEDQVAAFNDIMRNHHAERKTRREALRAEREANRQLLKDQLASVLSEEQLAQFDTLSSQKRGHKRGKKRGGHKMGGACADQGSFG